MLENLGDGIFTQHPWMPDVILQSTASLTPADLNQDGLTDLLFVDNRYFPALLTVALGGAVLPPTVVGRYPLAGAGGAIVLGDFSGDGVQDVAVLERSLNGQGGVHLFVNGFSAPTAVSSLVEEHRVPEDFRLSYPFPNPFNPEVAIRFRLFRSQGVSVGVYDILGQRIADVLTRAQLPVGDHGVAWDGRRNDGREVAAGPYLIRVVTQHHEQSRKVLKLD